MHIKMSNYTLTHTHTQVTQSLHLQFEYVSLCQNLRSKVQSRTQANPTELSTQTELTDQTAHRPKIIKTKKKLKKNYTPFSKKCSCIRLAGYPKAREKQFSCATTTMVFSCMIIQSYQWVGIICLSFYNI